MSPLWKRFRKTGEEQPIHSSAPLGTVIAYAGATAPGGWIDLTPAAVWDATLAGPYKASDYPQLADMLGTVINTGIEYIDAPTMKGRTAIGYGSESTVSPGFITIDRSYAIGEQGGETSVLLTAAQSGLRNHNDHTVGLGHGHGSDTTSNHAHSAEYDETSGAYSGNQANTWRHVIGLTGYNWTVGSSGYNLSLSSTTTGATIDYYSRDALSAHENRQPSLQMLYIMKAWGD